jgi:hypothetical protein
MSYLSEATTGANRKMMSLLDQATIYDMSFNFMFPSFEGVDRLVKGLSKNGYSVKQKRILGGKIGLFLWLLARFSLSKAIIVCDLVPTPAVLLRNFLWLIHDIRPAHGYKGKFFTKKIYLTLLKQVNRYVSVSEFSSSEIRNVNPDAEVIIWSNGIDKQFWTPDILPDKNLILSFLIVGNFEDRKRHCFVLRSLGLHFSALKQKVSLSVVGNMGPTFDEFLVLSEEYSEFVDVTILSGVSDIKLRTLYQTSSLVIIPSSYEGFGMTVLEATFSSARFICSDIKAHIEVGNSSYIYFKKDDREDLIKKIGEALSLNPRWWNSKMCPFLVEDVNFRFEKKMASLVR